MVAATNAAAHPAVSAPLGTHLGTPAADQRAAAAEVKGEANGSMKRFPRSAWRLALRTYPREPLSSLQYEANKLLRNPQVGELDLLPR